MDLHRYYCTYFDKGYLIRGLALHESLLAHEKEPFTLFVVCLDEITRLILDRLALPGVFTVPLHHLEAGDFDLQAARHSRSLKEYYWTLTPTVLLRLLKWHPEIEYITYLDADLFFFSAPEPIFEEFEGCSVLIHEHRFHESFKPALKYGRFNVGLLCFRNDAEALMVLRWWRDRCNEWCYAQYQDGKFGDQLYLEDWPVRFRGVRVLQHIGAGVAPWNCVQYHFAQRAEGAVTVDGLPLIFYHFHAIVVVNPDYIVLSWLHRHKFSPQLVFCCYLPYSKALRRAISKVEEILPGFKFGIYTDETDDQCAAIVSLQGEKPPSSVIRFDDEYSLLLTPQILLPND